MLVLVLSILSPLFPIIRGAQYKNYNVIFLYCVASFCTDLLATTLKRGFHLNNAWPANVFEVIEFTLFLLYYKNKVFTSNTLFYSVFCSGILFFLLSTTFGSGWLTLNRTGISIMLCVFIVLSIAGFYKILKEQKILQLEKDSFFWVNVAILTYSSGAFFLFLGADAIRSIDKQLMIKLWYTFFVSLNILKNILLGIALSKKEEH